MNKVIVSFMAVMAAVSVQAATVDLAQLNRDFPGDGNAQQRVIQCVSQGNEQRFCTEILKPNLNTLREAEDAYIAAEKAAVIGLAHSLDNVLRENEQKEKKMNIVRKVVSEMPLSDKIEICAEIGHPVVMCDRYKSIPNIEEGTFLNQMVITHLYKNS